MRFLFILPVLLWTLLIFTAGPLAGVQAQTAVTTHWHPPTEHEHGDPEPQWLTDALLAYPQLQAVFGGDASGHLAYDVPFNTGPAENRVASGKHFAFKGLRLTYSADKATGFHGRNGEWLDGYARVHLSGTPVDRGSRFHSATVWIAGEGKLLAVRQGWLDTGNVDTSRVPNVCPETPSTNPELAAICNGFDPNQRPIVKTVTADSLTGKYAANGQPNYQEQWYSNGIGFSWAWGISDAPSMAQAGEKLDDYDFGKWGLIRGANGQQSVGLLRQLDLTAKAQPYHELLFYTNQFGDYIADQNGLECQLPNICLAQWYNDFPGIEGKNPVTDFPGRGQVKVPN